VFGRVDPAVAPAEAVRGFTGPDVMTLDSIPMSQPPETMTKASVRLRCTANHHEDNEMTDIGGDSRLSNDRGADDVAWQFLINASKVSFGTLVSLASPTTSPQAESLAHQGK
jgi:hypothetical protein